MSNVGFAACSMLMLGCVCLTGTPAAGCTGGGPLCRLGREALSVSSAADTGWTCEAGCRTTLGPASFLGGVGACSGAAGIMVGSDSAPRGPSGSKASSTASRRVAWTPTLRAGCLRAAAPRAEPVLEVVVDCFVDCEVARHVCQSCITHNSVA